MADLAAAGGAQAADLTRAVGREVVVEDELFLLGAAGHGVEVLGVLAGAEGDGGQVLRLAAVEDGRAVDAGEDADLGGEGADLVLGAAVDALAALEEVRADGLDLQGVEEVDELDVVDDPLAVLVLAVLVLAGGEELVADGLHGGLALQLAGDDEGVGQAGAGEAADEAHLLGVLGLVGNDLVGLAQGAAHLDLQVDDLLDLLMGALHRGQEVGLGNLLGGALHHEELAAQAGVEQVQVGFLALGVGGVDDPFAVDAADAHAANRAHEGHLGDVERGGGRVHGADVAVDLAVAAHQHGVDLDVVVVAVGEERADGAVAHARRQRLLLGGARLALEEAAREAARRVELLAVLALQREEVDALARLVRAGHGAEDAGVADGDDHGAGGLTRQEARLDGELPPGDLRGELLAVLHGLVVFVPRVVAGKSGAPPCPRLGLLSYGLSARYRTTNPSPRATKKTGAPPWSLCLLSSFMVEVRRVELLTF